jgi:hypothetical protein
MLMDYKEYCNVIFLTEENQKEVFDRLHSVFPEDTEFSVYSSILNLFPSLNAKSMIVTLLIRTKMERHKSNITPHQTKAIFDEYIVVLKRNVKIDLAMMIKNDRVNHLDEKDSQLFTQFTEIVHQNIAKISAVDAKRLQKKSAVRIEKPAGEEEEETIDTKFPNTVYKDENVEIYEARSPGECEVYEGGSTICLKTPGHFWGSYRIPHASAFYFVFPRTPKNWITDPIANVQKHRFLLVDVRKDGSAVWTWEENSMNYVDSLQAVVNIFPFLRAPFTAGVFKKRPIMAGETENYKLVQNPVSDQQFFNFTPEVKNMYISNQHILTDRQWTYLSRDQKNDYINFCLNKDLSDFQYDDTKKDLALVKRYISIKKRGLHDKIDTGQFLRDGITKHEAAVLPNLMSSLNDSQKDTISKGLVKGMKDILSGREVPKQDISGIYNLFKGQLLADPAMQSDEILNSIADILGGGKTNTWKTLPAKVKESVYGVAMDLFNANPQKMKNIVDEKIKQNLGVLLEGLLDVPTDFQVKYFNIHEKELLSDLKFFGPLTQSLEGNLIYGTDMSGWLKSFWETHKKEFFTSRVFMDTIRRDLQAGLYGKDSDKHPDAKNMSADSRELLNLVIDDIRKDPSTMDIVESTVYNSVLNKGADMDHINTWEAGEEFKRYYSEHAKQLKVWITFKIIDEPPSDIPPLLTKTISEYKEIVLSNPEFRNKIEDRLVTDLIIKNEKVPDFSGDRVEYWLTNFWDILNKTPGLEQKLVDRTKTEFGVNNTANAWYSSYGIPYEFYKKYEKEILSDPDAYRGLKTQISELLIWRNDQDASTVDVVNDGKTLSQIEKDFYLSHKKDFPEKEVTVNNRKNR